MASFLLSLIIRCVTRSKSQLDDESAISINHLQRLQRLPDKKLAMSYGNTSVEVEVAEADIVVLGRVVLVKGKE